MSEPLMNAARLRECLDTLNRTTYWLAKQVRRTEKQVYRWEGGARIPDVVALWLEHCVRLHHANPPPTLPDQRKKDAKAA